MIRLSAFILGAVFAGQVFAGPPSRAECQSQLHAAEAIIAHRQDQWNVGEISRALLLEARLDLLDLKLTCLEIRRDEYCSAESKELMVDFVEGVRSEWAIGQRDYVEVQKSLQRKAGMDAICQ